METSSFDNDFFKRKQIAKWMVNYIKKIDEINENHKDDFSHLDSNIIGVKSKHGDGKSYFAKEFNKYIQEDYDKEMFCVYFNFVINNLGNELNGYSDEKYYLKKFWNFVKLALIKGDYNLEKRNFDKLDGYLEEIFENKSNIKRCLDAFKRDLEKLIISSNRTFIILIDDVDNLIEGDSSGIATKFIKNIYHFFTIKRLYFIVFYNDYSKLANNSFSAALKHTGDIIGKYAIFNLPIGIYNNLDLYRDFIINELKNIDVTSEVIINFLYKIFFYLKLSIVEIKRFLIFFDIFSIKNFSTKLIDSMVFLFLIREKSKEEYDILVHSSLSLEMEKIVKRYFSNDLELTESLLTFLSLGMQKGNLIFEDKQILDKIVKNSLFNDKNQITNNKKYENIISFNKEIVTRNIEEFYYYIFR